MTVARPPIQAGAYFVTLAAVADAPAFSRLHETGLTLTAWGEALRAEWFHTAELRPYVRFDAAELVIMPNHLHGVIWVVGEAPPDAPASVMDVLHGFMRATTRRINTMRGTAGAPLWLVPPFEHPIRDAFVLHAVRTFIQLNPLHWAVDLLNPLRRGEDTLTQELLAIFRASMNDSPPLP